MIDETCPAAGVLAAVNQMQGPKEVVFLPKGEHQAKNNTHAAFDARARVWKEALLKGEAAPVKRETVEPKPTRATQ